MHPALVWCLISFGLLAIPVLRQQKIEKHNRNDRGKSNRGVLEIVGTGIKSKCIYTLPYGKIKKKFKKDYCLNWVSDRNLKMILKKGEGKKTFEVFLLSSSTLLVWDFFFFFLSFFLSSLQTDGYTCVPESKRD